MTYLMPGNVSVCLSAGVIMYCYRASLLSLHNIKNTTVRFGRNLATVTSRKKLKLGM